MLSWAQRTARWTVRSLPFSFGRPGTDRAGTDRPAIGRSGTDHPGDQEQETQETQETADTVADRVGEEGVAATAGPARSSDHGPRHRPSHERAAGPPARGRHAAPSRSRRPRSPDAG
jgi:hypothetical protein